MEPTRRHALMAAATAAAALPGCALPTAAPTAPGRTFVLVHGAWHGGWCWRDVKALPEQQGHRVHAPSLTGLADRSHLLSTAVTLQTHIDDVVNLLRWEDLRDVVLVAHSVAAMIGVLATLEEPDRFAALVMVGPSPRYVDDEEYVGGFAPEDIDELLESLASNYLGWSTAMAPAIVGNPDRPELGHELTEAFCRTDPDVARRFAEATFRSDNRADLPRVPVPTLVLQCREDIIAPMEVGAYVAEQVPDADLVVLDATGHCPQLSAPELTTAAIATWLDGRAAV